MTFNYVNFKEVSNKYLLNKLKIKYINYDNNYFKNYHNKKYFKVSKIRNRTILTEYGLLTYSRRIYKNIQDEFNIYISKTTISNIFKNIKIKQILPKEKIKVKDNEFIYNLYILMLMIVLFQFEKIIKKNYKKLEVLVIILVKNK